MELLDFKNQCKILRKKGYTLSEIVTTLNRPKTTVFFHIKDIPISRFLKNKISNIKSRQARLNIARGLTPQKGQSALGRKYRDFKIWSSSSVNLIAHAIFDGEIKYGGVIYHNRCRALIDNFRSKMRMVYDFDPILITNGDVTRISYHNVELGLYFKLKKEELLQNIVDWPLEFKRSFLVAFFDDEGSVDFRKQIRRVRGYQHNNRILTIVQKLLANFDVDSKVDTRFHEIIIGRRENIKKFAEEINFSKGLRINGKRSNSVWKKSLEKRKILANLLASYR